MMGSVGPAPSVTSAVFVCNLPRGTSEILLADHFGQAGLLKKDRISGAPKVWLYRDELTHELNGYGTVTFEDPHCAAAAAERFNNTEFNGNIISVSIAGGVQTLSFHATSPTVGYPRTQDVFEHGADSSTAGEAGWDHGGVYGGDSESAGGSADFEGARGRGRVDGKPWQQEGDWPCTNPSCVNINFAFRGVCNRCGSARPPGGVTGGGRGRGRGASDAGARGGRGSGGPPGLFGPNDWNCSMCGNINWAKRTKCNICNTTKPGYNEGGVREGRAGGFKEFDEAEMEEVKRRRRELEEDDGERYDEFGNLKKKFRMKAKVGNTLSLAVPRTGVGKAGWEKEDGVVEGKIREKNKDLCGYSDNSKRYENKKRSDFRELDDSQLDPQGYNQKERGCKRTKRDCLEAYQGREQSRGMLLAADHVRNLGCFQDHGNRD